MNCERFQILANELARVEQGSSNAGWLVEVKERESAVEHPTECDSCAAIWEEQVWLSVGLRGLARELNDVSASPQLEEKLLLAFRRRGKAATMLVGLPEQLRRNRYWLSAIAAVLVIAVGFVVFRGRLILYSGPQPASSWDARVINTGEIQPSVNDTSLSAAQVVAGNARLRRPRSNSAIAASRANAKALPATASARAENAADTNDATKEIATDFFPVGYVTAPNLQDGAQLVRVEMPRSAAARFGLPINMDRTSERVKADVLVGADGLAQAIRFVH